MHFDVIIIGFWQGREDPCGRVCKAWAKKLPLLNVRIKMYGGTCINIGCIPTKTLVHQAKNCFWYEKTLHFEEKE